MCKVIIFCLVLLISDMYAYFSRKRYLDRSLELDNTHKILIKNHMYTKREMTMYLFVIIICL